jgi:hypothetical protein
MNEEFEYRLREALRPVAPSDEFTRNLIARVAAEQRSTSDAQIAHGRRPRARGWWLSASMAASLLVAAGIEHQLQVRHERERGLEARREVIEALRVTSQKLNLAYAVIKNQSSSPADDKPGA